MFDEPGFSFLRPAIKPSSSSNGNTNKPKIGSHSGAILGGERKTNLKRALFFLVVAILLILARQVDKDLPTASSQSPSVLNVHFDLSIPEPAGKIATEQSAAGGYVVQFRLTNRGNRPVFCPVRSGTNVLTGQVVYRITGASEWMALSLPSKTTASSAQERIDQSLHWIEMPPGGRIDGQFKDPGWPDGDRAYAVDLKTEPNAKSVRVVSSPYHLPTN